MVLYIIPLHESLKFMRRDMMLVVTDKIYPFRKASKNGPNSLYLHVFSRNSIEVTGNVSVCYIWNTVLSLSRHLSLTICQKFYAILTKSLHFHDYQFCGRLCQIGMVVKSMYNAAIWQLLTLVILVLIQKQQLEVCGQLLK